MSAILSSRIVYAESALGIWTDKEGKHTYGFQKNNEFMFLTEKPTFKKKDKDIIADAPDGIVDDRLKVEGVWQSSPGMCWLGDKKQQTGNV
ncbi:MAG TPA: hypothetical protein VN328_12545, partial [Thermodesulfovibrionales bacterium]|nr:hypothetical protein [Thermodesulfovibrionales bacterium]